MKFSYQIFISIFIFIILLIINILLFKYMAKGSILGNPNFWGISSVLLTQVLSYIMSIFNANTSTKNAIFQNDYTCIKDTIRNLFDNINTELFNLKKSIQENEKNTDNIDFKGNPTKDIFEKISSAINNIEIEIKPIINSEEKIDSIFASYYKSMNKLQNCQTLRELQSLKNILKESREKTFRTLQKSIENKLGLF